MPDSPGVTAGDGARHVDGAVQRLRRGARAVCRATPTRSPPSSSSRSSATWACVAPARGFLQDLRELCTRRRRAADLRRGDDRLPRRAAAARRSAIGVTPDLTTLGKIIGGGLPVGALRRAARDLMTQVVAGRAGVPGGHDVGQPAGDGGRAGDARRDCGRRRALRSARSARRRARGRRARRHRQPRRDLPLRARRVDVDAVLHAERAGPTGTTASRPTARGTGASSTRCWRAASACAPSQFEANFISARTIPPRTSRRPSPRSPRRWRPSR